MKTIYVVYKIIYSGNKLPPYYIGSSTEEKLKNGYRGSIRSKKWSKIFYSELEASPNLFRFEILSMHRTRRDAVREEYLLQRKLNVVKSKDFFNESLAAKNGCFGRDVSGASNPMYGRKKEVIAFDVVSGETVRVSENEFQINSMLVGVTNGHLYVKRKTNPDGKAIKVSVGEYNRHKEKYVHCNLGKKASQKTISILRRQRESFCTVKDWNGNFHRVRKDDARITNGELVNVMSKKWVVVSPCGEKYETMALKIFCRKHNLRIAEYVATENSVKKYKQKIIDNTSGLEWELRETI